jgi:alpha,alpha-trehalose phosphorylase (configuration-retaining)
MSSKQRNTVYIRQQDSINFEGASLTMTTLLARFFRVFPTSLVKGLASFGRTILFSTYHAQRSALARTAPSIKDASPQEVATGPITPIVIPAATYLGIEEQEETLAIAETNDNTTAVHMQPLTEDGAETTLFSWLQQTAQERNLKFIAAALSKKDPLSSIASQLWLLEDIVPYVLTQQDEDYRPGVDDMARNIAANFDANNIVYTKLDVANEVQVSELVTLADYQRVTAPDDFALLTRLAQDFKGKKLVFINATPQGGGVALMRHALIRLLRLLDVDAHWYVLHPDKEAFDITKPKFHNVLQAVAAPGTELNEHDIEIYNAWIAENAVAFEDVFKASDVIVIDDPQPSGLIPYIKQANPAVKIIYRSHIQIVASLASQEGTPQRTTWSFIWDKAKEAECFISHPMKMFIPDDVPAEKIYYMPATTDPLDGLNKPLSEEQMDYYMLLFNQMLLQEGQTPLDEARPYIVQIARFDPSKGIPDVLEAYRKLRLMLEENKQALPQLVITGNGSIDDPDGIPIYNRVMEILHSHEFAHFADDIKVLRLPHIDQLLNTLLRRSVIVLQLSTKEGFEVKVTEALMKGKPVVAYHTGGIPLQIQDTLNGYLVEVGNTTQVAQHLYDLLVDPVHYKSMSLAATNLAGKDYLTVPNAICWLYMALLLLNGDEVDGNYQWVRALAQFYGQPEN